jgi:hypothetical protein
MTTSGTTDFDLSIDELVEEAFERCGMRPTSGYHLATARRSLNLVFLDWANRGLNLWTIELQEISLVQGNRVLNLATDTVNVLSAVIRDMTQTPYNDIIIQRISRNEYLDIPNKDFQARPSQYYVQRQNIPQVFLYPVVPNSNYKLVYYRIRRIQDAGAYTNTSDVNWRFLPCLASGLAYFLSLKFAADRVGALKSLYEEDFQRAANEDRDTASTYFVPQIATI